MHRDGAPVPREALRRRRQELAISQEELALRMGVAASTYAAWELGTRRITVGHRPKLARALGVTLTEVANWFDPVRVAPDGLSPTWLGTLAALEQGASELWAYQPIAIHALLQTAAYAAAVQRQDILPPSDHEVARWVQIRLARQQVLAREPDPLQLAVVIDESAMRRVAGDRAVMAEQLEHLATMAERPNIDVRVLPLDPGVHVAAFGAFTLLTAAGATAPYMVVQTDWGSAHYFERPEIVAAHATLFRHMQGMALSPTGSIDLCHAIAQEHRT